MNFLPTTKEEMQKRGWNEIDVILVTGDAYVDHPAFGIAVIGRVLESKGYRVGIISMPESKSSILLKINLFLGIIYRYLIL